MLHAPKWKMLSILMVVGALVVIESVGIFAWGNIVQPTSFQGERVQLRARIVQEDVVSNHLRDLRKDVRNLLNDRKLGAITTSGVTLKDDQITIGLVKTEDAEKVKTRLAKLLRPIASSIDSMKKAEVFELDLIRPDDKSIVLKITQDGISESKFAAVAEAVAVLKRRYGELGFTNVSVHKNVEGEIEISIPTNLEIEEVKQIAELRGKVGGHLVDHSMSVEAAEANKPPFGSRLLGDWGDVSGEHLVLIKNRTVFTGQDILDVIVDVEKRLNEPIIKFRFSEPAKIRFCKFTEDHIGHDVAIVMDNVSLSVSQIYEPICGGMGQISAGFTPQQAETLSILIKNGALPAKLEFIDE